MGNQRIASSLTDLAPQANPAASGGGGANFQQPNYSSASDAVIVDFGQTMSCLYPNAGGFAFNAMLQMPEIDEVAFMECEDHTLTDPVQLALSDPECACEQSTYWARMYGANCFQENVKYCCSAAETPCGAIAKARGYHPDYLGSIEAVTDARGEVYQFFHNTIWGEPLQDQRAVLYNSFTSPYRFNGKERDWESGNYYYGARYYDPKISMWLSVDPLASKAPGLTPYRFCFNNPINIVDPTGLLEDWYVSADPCGSDEAIWLPSDKEAAKVFGEGGFVNLGAEIGDEVVVTGGSNSENGKSNATPAQLQVAQGEYGQMDSQHKDQKSQNPRVMEYHSTTCNGQTGEPCTSDHDAWCASFVNWCNEQARLPYNDNPYSANAWSFKRTSGYREIDKPAFGAIALIGNGHVTFVIGQNESGTYIHGYGGNQGNMVKVSTYKESKARYFYAVGLTPNYTVPIINFNFSRNESTR